MKFTPANKVYFEDAHDVLKYVQRGRACSTKNLAIVQEALAKASANDCQHLAITDNLIIEPTVVDELNNMPISELLDEVHLNQQVNDFLSAMLIAAGTVVGFMIGRAFPKK